MIERAIVQQMIWRGDDQVVRDCPRPKEVRAMADRVREWVKAPEGCSVCRDKAIVIRDGNAYCHRHRDEVRYAYESTVPADQRATFTGAQSAQLLIGHAIVFNQRSVDLGGFTEIIRPEAIDRSIRERTDIRALWNHDSNEVIGRVGSGTLAVKKTTRGLAVAIDPPKWADKYVETVERGDVSGMSFAFRAIVDEWRMEDDTVLREIDDMHTKEVSIVGFPAYPAADVKVSTVDTYLQARARVSRSMRERELRAMGL